MDLAPGSPRPGAIAARIRKLQGELAQARSVLGPLIPDANSPRSLMEQRGDRLADALASLMQATEAKQESPLP